VAFASKPALPTFDPKESEDNDRNRYLWWKIADEQPHTPPLADIKPEVVKAWKMIEARKPAKAKAEKLAEEVRKSKLPIREAMEGTKNADVITAGPFSWLDRGMFRQAPQIAKVAGVEMPGPDFMKTVFSLDPKETAVTSNLPENIYYVVQVESFEPPLDILENGFMTAMANPSSAQEYAVVGAQEHYYDDRAWFKELQDQFNFQFAPRSAVKESNDTGEGE
jgi:hypothetical protein